MSNDKLAQALRDIIGVTSATPSMTEQQLGLAMGRIQEICESALAAHEAEKQAGPVAGQVAAPVDEGLEALRKMLQAAVDQLTAAPPSPLTEQDKEDAERWRELRRQHESDDAYALTLFGPDDDEGLSPIGSMPGELDEAIDTARAARAKKEQP